jgi:uncharacterized protein YjgD (DUF1641 family)
MAKFVTTFPKLANKREELLEKLSEAPIEHAAALLDLYQLAQVMHDKGTLDFLRGLVGASDDIIGRVANGMSQPESIRAVRNLVEVTKLLAKIDPATLHASLEEGGEFFQSDYAQKEPPSMWTILRRMTSRDARRALSVMADALNGIGRSMGNLRSSREQ